MLQKEILDILPHIKHSFRLRRNTLQAVRNNFNVNVSARLGRIAIIVDGSATTSVHMKLLASERLDTAVVWQIACKKLNGNLWRINHSERLDDGYIHQTVAH